MLAARLAAGLARRGGLGAAGAATPAAARGFASADDGKVITHEVRAQVARAGECLVLEDACGMRRGMGEWGRPDGPDGPKEQRGGARHRLRKGGAAALSLLLSAADPWSSHPPAQRPAGYAVQA